VARADAGGGGCLSGAAGDEALGEDEEGAGGRIDALARLDADLSAGGHDVNLLRVE
jgi:hypothetical protein